MRTSSYVSSLAALLFAACSIWACSSSDTTPAPAAGGSGGATEGGVGGTAGKAGGGTGGTAGGGLGGQAGTAGGGQGGTAGGGTGGTAGGGGGSCVKAEDCGDTKVNVCDPATATCTKGQCDSTTECPTGKTCLAQVSQASVGACYTECTAVPTETGCASGESCVSTEIAAPGGACKKTGAGAADGPCDAASPNSSRCVAGYNCIQEGSTEVCRKLCDFWGTSDCGATLKCDGLWMTCVGNGEATAIGGTCTGDDGIGCAPTGGKYAGICNNGTCVQWCHVSPDDCPSGMVCGPLSSGSAVGLCETAPVPPPDGWTCKAEWYADGYCDCKCGAWDTDCDDPTNQVMDCDADAGEGPVCISVGVCGYAEAGATDSAGGG
ncbi:MAG: hypothetical protein HY898_24345 [Deltaproteobacteria bacterium]|nr:hypothetical protein [Deltaproteobacteria bacterium]